MKFAKLISAFLLLFFVLQLLPVKQVIRYFYVDNSMAEELLHTAEKSTHTVSFFEEEIELAKNHLLLFTFLPAANTYLCDCNISFYATTIADIETPPPNYTG